MAYGVGELEDVTSEEDYKDNYSQENAVVSWRLIGKRKGDFALTPFSIYTKSVWKGEIIRKFTGTRLKFEFQRELDIELKRTGLALEFGLFKSGVIKFGYVNGTERVEFNIEDVNGGVVIKEEFPYQFRLAFVGIDFDVGRKGFLKLLFRLQNRPDVAGESYDLQSNTDVYGKISFGKQTKKRRKTKTGWEASYSSYYTRRVITSIYHSQLSTQILSLGISIERVDVILDFRLKEIQNIFAANGVSVDRDYTISEVGLIIKRPFD